MNNNFIKCSDADTIAKLKKLGFSVVSEGNGITTFLNDKSIPVRFSTGEKVVYTNKIDYGG